jgi:hypothetical protein
MAWLGGKELWGEEGPSSGPRGMGGVWRQRVGCRGKGRGGITRDQSDITNEIWGMLTNVGVSGRGMSWR